jgi:large repetitive protein
METRDFSNSPSGRGGGVCLGYLLFSLLLGALSLSAQTTNILRKPRFSDAFTYLQDNRSEGPWAIHMVRIRRSRVDLQLHVTLGGGNALGASSVSEQVRRFPRSRGRPVAAINGDYFVRSGAWVGDPEGLCIFEGRLVSMPSEKSCFWVEPDGSFHMTNVISLLAVVWPDGSQTPLGLNEEREDRAVLYTEEAVGVTRPSSDSEIVLETLDPEVEGLRVGERRAFRVVEVGQGGRSRIAKGRMLLVLPSNLRAGDKQLRVGSTLIIDSSTLPNLKGARTAIGGGPALIRGGLATELGSGEVRHPRSALGWNKEMLFLMQVDGRQPSVSVGMTLSELTRYLLDLGCTEALNLDGGGSSTLWVLGQVLNNPCERAERPTGNALVITLESKPEPR